MQPIGYYFNSQVSFFIGIKLCLFTTFFFLFFFIDAYRKEVTAMQELCKGQSIIIKKERANILANQV